MQLFYMKSLDNFPVVNNLKPVKSSKVCKYRFYIKKFMFPGLLPVWHQTGIVHIQCSSDRNRSSWCFAGHRAFSTTVVSRKLQGIVRYLPGRCLQHVQQQRCGQRWLAVDERRHTHDAQTDGLLIILLQNSVTIRTAIHDNLLRGSQGGERTLLRDHGAGRLRFTQQLRTARFPTATRCQKCCFYTTHSYM